LLPVGLAVTGPGGVIFGINMAIVEPETKRAVGFFDGQNLFHHAKAAFGHYHPNYDPRKLLSSLCLSHGWRDSAVRFYTGVPSAIEEPMWHGYWNARLLSMTRSGILVTKRELRYHRVSIVGEDGSTVEKPVPQEKGIDVRLALDVVRLARQAQFDVAVIFSQDQDLAEVVKEVKDISRDQNRWLKVVSAFPAGPNATAGRGIDGADWIGIDQATYDACLDPHDYRPKIDKAAKPDG
jgi:uncharacterized LabA/DUF88 family protein